MKIGIDISQAIYSTGVSTYTVNLVRNLLEIDKENEYILYAGSLRSYAKIYKIGKDLTKNRNNTTLRGFLIPPMVADFFWNKLHIFNIEYFTGNLDVFHSSDWTQPPSKAKKVTTIHDLVPILYPKISNKKIVSVHKRRLEIVKKECDRIIVPTQTTVNDLKKLGYDLSKVVKIPEAWDLEFVRSNKDQISKILNKYHIRGKYLLAVGTSERKNIERIINSYINVKSKFDIKLVVVGELSQQTEENRGVISVGRIPKDELIALYSGSEMLLYPSLYEGFGLPILEAFSIGIPVITSNSGSMKEIAGGAAYFVDPYSVDQITKAIIHLMKRKNEYIKKGKMELEKYSWKNTAKLTLDVYQSLVN